MRRQHVDIGRAIVAERRYDRRIDPAQTFGH
jgi:hypothetical protein